MLKQHHYEIHVRGDLEDGWDSWFTGIAIKNLTNRGNTDGITVISGLMDHAALHGVLSRVRDLGLCLLSVQLIEPGPEKSVPNPNK